MDSFRKQLDALMGANRNGDVEEVQRNYYDRDVCRLHLAGLCPHELFQLTKMDMGPCTKLHSLQLRKEYEAAKSKGKANFNQELEEVLGRLIGECDRKIVRALRRLEDDDAKAATAISVSKVSKTLEAEELTKQIKQKIKGIEYLDLEGKTDEKIRIMEEIELLRAKRADVQAQAILDAFNKDRASMPQPMTNPPTLAPLPTLAPPDARTQEIIQEKLKRAEELGELGMIDEAQKAMEEAEALRKLGARHEVVLDPAKIAAANVQITDQKLRVCDICGAFLSVYDSDRRLADHFGGKLHLGYMQIREKVDDIQEEEKNSRHRSDDDRYHDQNNSRERGMDRDRDRDRERNRERSHALESRRDRDNERGRDREYPDHSQHSRDIDRASERDRGGRDYYYHGHSSNPISSGRRRSPSKSRSRDRSQERSRDRDRSQERSRDRDRSEYYRRQQRY